MVETFRSLWVIAASVSLEVLLSFRFRYKGSNSRTSMIWASSVHISVTWLGVLFVCNHLLLEADENLFHGRFWTPLLEQGELVFNKPVWLVHWRHVDLRLEADLGCLSGIVGATGDGQTINSTVHVSVGGTDDRSVPVGESLVVSGIETVADALVWKCSLFSLFKLFVKPECSGHYNVNFWLEKLTLAFHCASATV